MTGGCDICPRGCGAVRAAGETGYCGAGPLAAVAKTMLHMWEEPPVSGTRGSGAVFFSGCNLRCTFCQNIEISRSSCGKTYDADGLVSLFLALEAEGAHNINLVTPTPHLDIIIPALEKFKKRSSLPVVYNTSAFESAARIARLSGLVDIYLPDLKYYSRSLSGRFSEAEDYFMAATAAIDEMVSQQPRTVITDGLMKSGVIVRHMVLPGQTADSIAVMREIAQRWGSRVLVSVMRQFTPQDGGGIDRRLTSLEYNRVISEAALLGLKGFSQGKGSAEKTFTPDF